MQKKAALTGHLPRQLAVFPCVEKTWEPLQTFHLRFGNLCSQVPNFNIYLLARENFTK
jgi:hypothetical protein